MQLSGTRTCSSFTGSGVLTIHRFVNESRYENVNVSATSHDIEIYYNKHFACTILLALDKVSLALRTV